MRRNLFALLAIVTSVGLMATGCGSDDGDQEVKAAFIYVGPVGDAGWTWAHDQGRQFAAEATGVETAFVEMVPEGTADFGNYVRDFIGQGYNVIFGTSFGYMDDMLALADEYPDVVFEHISGYKANDTNFGNTFGRMYEPRYLSGMVAGSATSSNLIGYVAAFPIPEVIRGINAFTLGVREVNPDAQVEVNWTSTWFDPAVEGDSAQALLDKGADVIAMHQDSTAAGEKAEAAGARWVSYNSDMSAFAPVAYLTAPVWNWGPRYVEIIEAAQAGTYTPGYYWGSMADGVVDLAPIAADVDSGVTDQVLAAKEAIIAGDLHPFTGPLHDQDGYLVLGAGEVMDDGTMLGMSFFVYGVIGSTGAEEEAAARDLSGFTVVSEIVQGYVDDHGLNGASLIVVDRDAGVLYQEHSGELGPGRITMIGPLAEMISAGVVLRLHEDGLLDVDAPVADVVAWGSGNPEVTLAQLLSHSSGMVGGLPSQFYAPYTCSVMFMGSLQGCGETIFTTPDDDADLVPPDTVFGWPATGADYQVAGAVAEVASGKTWAELVDETYAPCGLEVLAYNNPWFQLPFDPATFAYPSAAFNGDPSTLAPTENPSIEAGAYTTPDDYAALLLMHLRDGMCGDQRVLSTESLERMHEDRIARVYDGGNPAWDPETGDATGEVWGYGMGFMMDREVGGRPGMATPFGQQIWMDLDTGYAALLLLESSFPDALALYDLVPDALHEAILTARG